MKRILLSISATFFILFLKGQSVPVCDHYYNNTLSFNPAFAGSSDALSVTILYRNQWVGFTDAPKNNNISVHTPLKNDRIGLGLLLENSSYGINRETGITGNYAYRLEAGRGILALGLGFGAIVKYSDWSKIIAADQNDLLLMNNPETAVLPDFSLGMYYYTRKYFLGLSLPMLLTHELNPTTGKYSIKNDFSEYSYFLEGGYFFDLTRHLKMLPSCLVKYHAGNKPQIDINTSFIIQDRIWLGLGYRNTQTLLGLLQLQISRQFMMAYSYSFDSGTMGKNNNGSHEVVLNYLFNYSRKVPGPRQN